MSSPRLARLRAARPARFARRFVHFWIVWTLLLFIHEGGHSLAARAQGLDVRRVTVGMGPALARGDIGDVDVVVRLVPLAGMTTLDRANDNDGAAPPHRPHGVLDHAALLGSGIAATLALALALAGMIALRERSTHRRAVWSRAMLADALVLSVFNLLPVPPLDGGRALLDAISAVRGAPLSGDSLFWLQAGGLVLAIVPMTLWTRWTARIDRLAMRWGAPVAVRERAPGVEATPPGSRNEEPRAAA